MAKCSRTRSIESTSFLSFGTREAKRRAAGRPEVFALWKEAVVLQLPKQFFQRSEEADARQPPEEHKCLVWPLPGEEFRSCA